MSPPSTTSACPVMKLASSEHRKTIALAMSSRAAHTPNRVLVDEVVQAGGVFFPPLPKPFGHDVTRTDGVHPDPVRSKFSRKLPGDADDRMLACLVDQRARERRTGHARTICSRCCRVRSDACTARRAWPSGSGPSPGCPYRHRSPIRKCPPGCCLRPTDRRRRHC